MNRAFSLALIGILLPISLGCRGTFDISQYIDEGESGQESSADTASSEESASGEISTDTSTATTATATAITTGRCRDTNLRTR